MISLISFTGAGYLLSEAIRDYLNHKYTCRLYYKGSFNDNISSYSRRSLSDLTEEAFKTSEAVIFIGACGIAVRSIAPYIQDKYQDPAVIVIDEKGKYVIPLLSGHVGGANHLASMIAKAISAQPVITTATDLNGLFAVDEFAVKNDLVIAERELAKKISVRLLEGEDIYIYIDPALSEAGRMNLLSEIADHENGGVHVTDKRSECSAAVSVFTPKSGKDDGSGFSGEDSVLHLIPKETVWIGTGCRKGISAEYFENTFMDFLAMTGIDIRSIAGFASADLKADEECIISTAEKFGKSFVTYSAETLMNISGEFDRSAFVMDHAGVDNVCERAAVCASAEGRLIIKKTKFKGITMAAAIC